MEKITIILNKLRKMSNIEGNKLIDELIKELLGELDKLSVKLKP